MSNRQVFPSALFPLRGDISSEAGATSVIVQGLQGIPIISPSVEPIGLDTLFYDSYNNDWFYASPWDIPVGTPLVWEGYGYGSSGISWIAPDTLAFGNGTDGDVSGAAAMTALVLFGSASYYGPYNDYDVDYGPSYDQFYTSIFSGATQNWNLILPPNPGMGGQVLTTNGTGVTYWSTVSGGGGSGTVTSFSSGNLSPLFTTSVATPTTTPALSFSLNIQNANLVFAGPVSGGADTPTFRALVSTDIPIPGSTGDILYNNGGVLGASLSTITAAGSMTLPEGQVIRWSGAVYSGVGLSILAADTLAVGNGTASDVSGGMAMTALILYGSSYYSAYDAYQTTILSGALQDWSLVLPETAGTAGQVLTNIGSGFTAWESLTTIGVPWSSLTNPTTNLSLIMGTDTTTFNYATGLASAWTWQNNTPTVTGSSTTVALSTSTAPTHSGGVSWTYTLAASESGAGSNGWLGALVTISGYTGGATGNNGASLLITASTTTTVTLSNPTGTTINTGTPVMISSAVSSSPVLQIAGTVNTGTAGTLNSVADVWSIQNVLGSVAPNPTSTLTFTHSGSSGVAAISIPGQIIGAAAFVSINLSGNILWEFQSPTLRGGSGQVFSWSSTAAANGTSDTGLSRISGGIIGVGTGAAASIAGSIQCASIALNGAVVSPTAGVYYSGTNAGITQTAEAVGTLATTGGIVTTFTAVSDERLKVFESTKYGLAEILAITPITYRWNDLGQKYSGQSTERDFVGFSAQNVKQVIPEAVWESKDGYLGFDDRPVIAALVNAVKTLEARIRELEK